MVWWRIALKLAFHKDPIVLTGSDLNHLIINLEVYAREYVNYTIILQADEGNASFRETVQLNGRQFFP